MAAVRIPGSGSESIIHAFEIKTEYGYPVFLMTPGRAVSGPALRVPHHRNLHFHQYHGLTGGGGAKPWSSQRRLWVRPYVVPQGAIFMLAEGSLHSYRNGVRSCFLPPGNGPQTAIRHQSLLQTNFGSCDEGTRL